MELARYKERMEKIQREQKRLAEEERQLHNNFVNSHPWQTWRGYKVRVRCNDTISEWGYLARVAPCDAVVGCVVLCNIKKDGSRGKSEFNVYFRHDLAHLDVEVRGEILTI